MAALDELMALEQEISDLGKGLLSTNQRLKVLEKELLQARTSYEAAAAKVVHYRGLIRHMRTTADMVDLAEYRGAKETLANCVVTSAEASATLARLEKEKLSLLKTVANLELTRTQRRALLATYGEVRDFPIRHDVT